MPRKVYTHYSTLWQQVIVPVNTPSDRSEFEETVTILPITTASRKCRTLIQINVQTTPRSKQPNMIFRTTSILVLHAKLVLNTTMSVHRSDYDLM